MKSDVNINGLGGIVNSLRNLQASKAKGADESAPAQVSLSE
jgi:hypothetical protein